MRSEHQRRPGVFRGMRNTAGGTPTLPDARRPASQKCDCSVERVSWVFSEMSEVLPETNWCFPGPNSFREAPNCFACETIWDFSKPNWFARETSWDFSEPNWSARETSWDFPDPNWSARETIWDSPKPNCSARETRAV